MSVTIDGTTGVSKIQDGVIETADLIDATVTPAKLAQPFSAGTAVASTSGTSIDFTSIPSWVKRITVMFNGVSTSGTSNLLIQLGDSGGVETTGYASSYAAGSSATISNASSTAGFIMLSGVATAIASGVMSLQTLGSNTWVSGHTIKSTTTNTSFGGGDKTLSDTLDRIRITTVNGTDTFDLGSINILFE
jgi:hypothetical protein